LFILAICIFSAAFSGCSENNSTAENTVFETMLEKENKVAAGDETAPVETVDTSNLTPIYAADIKDGIYTIDVQSSSSMFKITECELTVSEGKMTAVMTMGGKGYLHIFMGKGENAEESGYIPFKENDNGEHTYTVPVEALDMEIECAAYSKNKEQWYNRILIFRSDSLPTSAFADGVIATVEALGLADGEYTIEVTLEGGSGRAKIQSPAKLTVENGNAFAEIIWGSSNYDYMTVNGERFDMINTEGNSAFKIPIAGFDCKIPVTADTTAMSTPYEIEYTLYFNSSTIKQE
ncbi:MAG: hypothetical protein K2J73_10615, partial [Oscillospiraceae bacterium]|nr:hypothetical protein [Oscillospiraceae bacterium]